MKSKVRIDLIYSQCEERAIARYRWVNGTDHTICKKHLPKLLRIGEITGGLVWLIHITEETNERCSQQVKQEEERDATTTHRQD